MTLASNEPIGCPARVGVGRVGATRVGAIPDINNVVTPGVYRWERSDGVGGDVNDGQPPLAEQGGYTTVRD